MISIIYCHAFKKYTIFSNIKFKRVYNNDRDRIIARVRAKQLDNGQFEHYNTKHSIQMYN